jgi:hypothetical protein
MSKGLPILTLAFAAAFAAVTPAHSQTLQVVVTINGVATNIGAGGSLPLASPGIGQAVFANVSVTNTGTAAVSVTGITLTAGTTEMTLSSQTTQFPFTLNPNSSIPFSVEYLPATGLTVNGQVSIDYGTNSTFQFTLTGVTSNFTFSYALATGGAVTVGANGVIAFPPTTVGTSVNAVVTVTNTGSATSTLQTVSLSGSAFQVTGSPAPVQLGPGQQTSFNVVFTPQTGGAAQASLVLGFTNTSVSFTVTGTGASPSFTVTYTLADGNVHSLVNGTAISFPSVDINATATATISILNQGTGAGSVTSISVTGAGFRGAQEPAPGATVLPGQGLTFQILFNPTQAGSFSGAFSIALSGSSISGTLAGSTASPNFILSYLDPATSNNLTLQNGATLPFPNTLVNTTSSIKVTAQNTGLGTGFLNSVALAGCSSPCVFQILNQPPLPASVPPTQTVSFSVGFSPLQPQTFSATLILNLNGQTVTINLTAQGAQPQYTYTLTSATGATTVSPKGTIAIGNTNVGQTSSVTVAVMNSGTGSGQISVLALTGGLGLSITNPPAVPFTLAPNASQIFTLNFAPTQPGPVSGTLTIGTDTFTVTATGAGPLLTYSYTNSASTISVLAGGVVIFQPTAVESQSSVTFTIQNTGTSSAAISSINLGAASTVFILQQLPSQPANLAPGGTITFTVNFIPNALGTLTANLLVNNVTFTLSGTGTQPASLPAYQFQGPSGTQAPAQQPSIGLTLSAPYTLALQGVLTLTFTSAVFTDDPSIQFATGGRTVTFTIPANSTQALFSNGATAMPMQTGTTAGTILITPSFATQNGFNLTPSSPTSLTLTIPSSVAQLSSESVTTETLTSFTVILSGYATTHALTQLNIQINPKPGDTFSTTNLTINVSSASSAWYQSTASTPFGGAFLLEIPFVLSNGSSTADLVHMLQSLTITATNGVGVSSSISVPIP